MSTVIGVPFQRFRVDLVKESALWVEHSIALQRPTKALLEPTLLQTIDEFQKNPKNYLFFPTINWISVLILSVVCNY